MNALTELLSGTLAQRIGWALVHFLWQGLAVAALLAAVLALLRHRSATARWAASCAALALMATLPVATAMLVPVDAPAPPAAAEVTDLEPLPAPISVPRPVDPATARPAVQAAAPAAPAPALVAAPTPPPTPWPQALAERVRPALPWALLAWLAGVMILSLWHFGGWLQVRRLRRVGLRPTGAGERETFARLLGRLRIRRPVRLATSLRAAVPVVVGWLRPIVLLPAATAAGLTPAQLEAVLAHELAHVRRWDVLVQALAALVETLLFYHPAVWWVARHVRHESEQCCDDLAVRACGDAWGYAEALAAVAASAAGRPAFVAAATGGSIVARVRRLIEPPPRGRLPIARCLSGLVALAAVVAMTVVVGVSCSQSSRAPVAAEVQTRFAGSSLTGEQEMEAIAEFHRLLADARDARRVNDLSTPWAAVATLVSAVQRKDLTAYQQAYPAGAAPAEILALHRDQWPELDTDMELRRIVARPDLVPGEDVVALYLSHPTRPSEPDEVCVLARLDGAWRKLYASSELQDWDHYINPWLRTARQELEILATDPRAVEIGRVTPGAQTVGTAKLWHTFNDGQTLKVAELQSITWLSNGTTSSEKQAEVSLAVLPLSNEHVYYVHLDFYDAEGESLSSGFRAVFPPERSAADELVEQTVVTPIYEWTGRPAAWYRIRLEFIPHALAASDDAEAFALSVESFNSPRGTQHGRVGPDGQTAGTAELWHTFEDGRTVKVAELRSITWRTEEVRDADGVPIISSALRPITRPEAVVAALPMPGEDYAYRMHWDFYDRHGDRCGGGMTVLQLPEGAPADQLTEQRVTGPPAGDVSVTAVRYRVRLELWTPGAASRPAAGEASPARDRGRGS